MNLKHLYFIKGFETSSSTMSFCLFELARNPDIQKKVQDEIDKTFKDAGTEGITYEMLADLKYLECNIDETLRKYPIVPALIRQATKDYKIPGIGQVIPTGVSVIIPVLGLHRDPEIYDDPMKYKPERFVESQSGGGKVKGLFYMPFGDGPRNCVRTPFFYALCCHNFVLFTDWHAHGKTDK